MNKWQEAFREFSEKTSGFSKWGKKASEVGEPGRYSIECAEKLLRDSCAFSESHGYMSCGPFPVPELHIYGPGKPSEFLGDVTGVSLLYRNGLWFSEVFFLDWWHVVQCGIIQVNAFQVTPWSNPETAYIRNYEDFQMPVNAPSTDTGDMLKEIAHFISQYRADKDIANIDRWIREMPVDYVLPRHLQIPSPYEVVRIPAIKHPEAYDFYSNSDYPEHVKIDYIALRRQPNGCWKRIS